VDPHDVAGALDAFTDGLERRIDLGDVNGYPFLNNVSLGLYGEAVRQSAYRDAKVRTLVETAARVLGPGGWTPAMRLVDDAGDEHSQLAVVLVSNNPYALDGLRRGSRAALDSGKLGILVLDAPGQRPAPGRAWTAADVEISIAGDVHAGIDGEAVLLNGPVLRFTLRPSALRVRIAARRVARQRMRRRSTSTG
jgi:diacylglycerol kinase family enzyme